MPETLNYRVGPHPGCPFKCLTCQSSEQDPSRGRGGALYVPDILNNREGPQAREPSKCLNRQSYRERLDRGLLIASYKRLKKRLC